MPEIVRVQTSSASYEVMIGRQLLGRAGEELKKLKLAPKAVIIADAALVETYGAVVQESLQAAGFTTAIVGIAGGERSKSLAEVTPLLSFIAQQRLDRDGAIIALGGGVIGDLAGFVAAIYLRGIAFIQIPTTLLAMVDSSVGGKTGVNLPEGKNLVGCFYQPRLVLADLDALNTLPPRELAAGMAEVIKYGIIADTSLFLKAAVGRPRAWDDIIRRCVEIKAEIVGSDERETSGRRALLNFGHTLGHAVEQASGYGELLHGEAVAIGMRAAAHLSQLKLGLSTKEVAQIEAALVANQLPLQSRALDRERLKRAMSQDKKVKAGTIRWVLSPRIGEATLVTDVSPAEIDQIIELSLN